MHTWIKNIFIYLFSEKHRSEAQECFCGESNCRGIIGGTKETVDALLYSLLNVANLEEPINGPEYVLEFIGLMLKSVEKYPAMVPGLLHRLEVNINLFIFHSDEVN